jgi:hypothetical protein
MDSRVTDKMKATASAPSPAYWAPVTDASAGSVSATGRLRGCPPWLAAEDPLPEDGASVGNSEDAFPPGLKVDPPPLRKGSPPAGSVEVAPDGNGTVVVVLGDVEPGADDDDDADGEADALGAVTEMGTDAFGSGLTAVPLAFLPLPVTVSCMDLTEVAVFAMAT